MRPVCLAVRTERRDKIPHPSTQTLNETAVVGGISR